MADLLALAPDPWDPDDAYLGFEQWAESRGLSLYPAQAEALIEIVSGKHLILSTPTGTGKSLVAVGFHRAGAGQTVVLHRTDQGAGV
jgi:superfamily II DNA or RNA helicase